MKNKLKSLAITVAAICIMKSALADSSDVGNIYGGIQYGISDFSISGNTETFNTDVILGRFGFRNNHVGLEARLGSGITSDTKTPAGSPFDVTASIDSLLGVYGVVNADFGEIVNLYGLLGVTRLESTLRGSSGSGFSETERDSGVSFGVGIDIGDWENLSVNLEYTSYIVDSDSELKSIGLGLAFFY